MIHSQEHLLSKWIFISNLLPLSLFYREASVSGHFPCQLCHHVSGAAAGFRGLWQGAVPPRDAHLHIPAARPERVQRGLPQLHRARPHRAIHHGGPGASRWATNTALRSVTERIQSLAFHYSDDKHRFMISTNVSLDCTRLTRLLESTQHSSNRIKLIPDLGSTTKPSGPMNKNMLLPNNIAHANTKI